MYQYLKQFNSWNTEKLLDQERDYKHLCRAKGGNGAK